MTGPHQDVRAQRAAAGPPRLLYFGPQRANQILETAKFHAKGLPFHPARRASMNRFVIWKFRHIVA